MRKLLLLITFTATLIGQSQLANAGSKLEVDTRVSTALESLYVQQPAAKELAERAAGILVFPRVIKAGAILGGEVGEGSLLVDNAPVQYYRVAGVSLGLQLGGQAKTEILMFMDQQVLHSFMNSRGWEAGVDGAVALATIGAGKKFDTNTIKDPIVGFVFDNTGLMGDISFAGSKFWRINKQ